MSQTISIQEEINKTLNSLDPEENDINKIAKATHRSLLLMSVKDVVMEMRDKEEKEEKRKKREGEGEEEKNDEMKKFHEKNQKSYLQKLNFLRRQLLN